MGFSVIPLMLYVILGCFTLIVSSTVFSFYGFWFVLFFLFEMCSVSTVKHWVTVLKGAI